MNPDEKRLCEENRIYSRHGLHGGSAEGLFYYHFSEPNTAC